MDFAKLYPPIEFPVSRGTPMISSLIKWDHSEDHFVISYDKTATRGERTFDIDLNYAEHAYLSGHTIDGKD